jgi:glycosyltransferase involved in cell wall biosynthesis
VRIALTVNFSPWSPYSGGAQRSTHNLASALCARGHDVTVVFTRAPGESFPIPSVPYRVVWAPFFGLRSRRDAPLRPLNALSVAWAIRKLATRRLDAVHGQGEEAALCGPLCNRFGFVFVMTPRFPDYPHVLLRSRRPTAAESVKLLTREPKFLALGRGLRTADWVCPTSDSAATMVRTAFGLDPRRIRVVPNGITREFFAIDRASAAPTGPLVYFGRLSSGKGVDTLVEALARVSRVLPPVKIVGRGDLREPMRRRVQELGLGGAVEFIDWLEPSELAALLGTARLAVLPSREESFGNAIAETMAAGCPVLSTRVGSIPEIVDEERTGTLVAPGDPQALADAIDRLLATPQTAEALAEAGRLDVGSRFSWDAVAARFEAQYERAGPQRRGGSLLSRLR